MRVLKKFFSYLFGFIFLFLILFFILAPATLIKLITGWEIPVRYNLDPVIEPLLANFLQLSGIINKTEIIKTGRFAFVEELNKERARVGLLPVKLTDNKIAQKKAELLLEYGENGHVIPSGFIKEWDYWIPPQLLYTYLGGKWYFEENIMHGYETIVNKKDVENKAKEAVRIFIYEDEESGWGHRDSLLNPCHNRIAVGIDWDTNYKFVVHISSEWIDYIKEPSYNNGMFEFSGYVDKRFEIEPTSSIFIYYLNPNKIEQMKSYYEMGDLIGGVTLKGYHYTNIQTIHPYYFSYDPSTGHINVKFYFKPNRVGVYTILMFGKDRYRISHPYKVSWNYQCPLLEYSFFVS